MERPEGIFLRASREIETVKRHGRRVSTELFNMLIYTMEDGPARVGIIVGRRFGNAVRRNRAKRVFRELVRQCHHDFIPGQAILVFPKREALMRPFHELAVAWGATLRRANVLRSRLT
ncbi:MAG: ribonuclease P protein component [Nitrospira sp.]|nr:ribonuclease P protein component [Nitrospira sp.]